MTESKSKDLAALTVKVHALLDELTADERSKVVTAVMTLFGQSLPSAGSVRYRFNRFRHCRVRNEVREVAGDLPHGEASALKPGVAVFGDRRLAAIEGGDDPQHEGRHGRSAQQQSVAPRKRTGRPEQERRKGPHRERRQELLHHTRGPDQVSVINPSKTSIFRSKEGT